MISNSEIGKRLTIRLKEVDGYRDLVGRLTSLTTIENRHGQTVEFDPNQIHIWREIIEVPRTSKSGAPLSIRIYELERTLNSTWRAEVEEERNGWIFRADNGINKRANSALVLNHFDQSQSKEIIDDLIGWYREKNLTPMAHLVPEIHSALDQELIARGFSDSLDAQVMVKDHAATDVDFEYEVMSSPSNEWLEPQGDQALGELMKRSEAKYVSIKDDERRVAVGRIGLAGDWAVLSRIWVLPELRSKGFGRKILNAMEAEVNAPKIALQVATDNHAAIKMYESAGYQTHHHYRFRALPQKIDLIQDLCC